MILTNMLAPLPAALANDGKADTLLFAGVADDVAAEAPRIADLTLRVLLSDPGAEGLPESQRLEKVVIRTDTFSSRLARYTGPYANAPAAHRRRR